MLQRTLEFEMIMGLTVMVGQSGFWILDQWLPWGDTVWQGNINHRVDMSVYIIIRIYGP